MRQAWHIFKKDVRYLWLEIGFFLLMSALFALVVSGLAGFESFNLGFVATAVYLISRVVHAESIPGANQFWITRPYHWGSLLGAKLLFLFIFVSVPVSAAKFIALVVVMGFPIGSVLPGLVWSQLVTFAGV